MRPFICIFYNTQMKSTTEMFKGKMDIIKYFSILLTQNFENVCTYKSKNK